MRAARIESYGGPEVIRIAEVPEPTPGPGEVVVQVYGSSVNPSDILVLRGWMKDFIPIDLPLTLGTDVAGKVAAIGEGVTEFQRGDSVFGAAGVVLGGSGAYADYALTRPEQLAMVPEGLDLVSAATLPLAGGAAVQALLDERQVFPGARVLIHGAPGGVGLFAVALAKHQGAYVVATAHHDNVPTSQEIRADEVLDTDSADVTALHPFDITIDLVGADPVLPITVTKPGGHAVGLRMLPDAEAAAAKGVTANLQYGQITADRLNRVAALYQEGVLRPHVAEMYDLGDVEKAFRTKEAGGVRGKIAIAVR